MVDALCGRPAAPPPSVPGCRVLFVGLDVHNDSIAVSLAPSDSTEVRRYGIIGGQHDDVLKLLKKLSAAHPGAALKFYYSARERAGWLIAVRQESFSHGPGPGRAAIRCAGSSARTGVSA
jgi:hypothetical protein